MKQIRRAAPPLLLLLVLLLSSCGAPSPGRQLSFSLEEANPNAAMSCASTLSESTHTEKYPVSATHLLV